LLALEAGLTLEQFWGLTQQELGWYLTAWRKRENRRLEVLAWHAANIMSCWTKRPVKPASLLNKSTSLLGMSKAAAKGHLGARGKDGD